MAVLLANISFLLLILPDFNFFVLIPYFCVFHLRSVRRTQRYIRYADADRSEKTKRTKPLLESSPIDTPSPLRPRPSFCTRSDEGSCKAERVEILRSQPLLHGLALYAYEVRNLDDPALVSGSRRDFSIDQREMCLSSSLQEGDDDLRLNKG
jgi:hypothetical protein